MNEQNNEQNKETKHRKTVLIIGAIVMFLIVLGGAVYWYTASKTVYIDQSVIEAPIINLSSTNSGILEALFVRPGDTVTAGEPVAQVGKEIVKAKVAGEIVSVDNNIGAFMNVPTGQGTVASMIEPSELRVVGHLDENKGLADVHVGDPATFTVDAFGGQTFRGVVSEVSPTSRQSDVVFDISNQRPTNEFDVKVRFDPSQYPELKNGMSARIWVYKQ